MRKLMLAVSLVLATSAVTPGCGSSGSSEDSGSSRSARREGSAKVKQTGKLYDAAKKNDAAAIEALLAEGYDIDSPGPYGRTALWIACYEGYVRTAVTLLDKGADPSIPDDRNKRTPLMYAADKRYVGLVKKMLEKKVDVNGQDERGMTAAHMAANKRDVETVRMLKAAGADLSIQDERGRTVDDILQITIGRKLADAPVTVPPPPATTNPLQ